MSFDLVKYAKGQTAMASPDAKRIREVIFFCPRCGKPKLYVNNQKKKWNCFHCSTGGDAVSLVMFVESVPREVAELVVLGSESLVKSDDEIRDLVYRWVHDGQDPVEPEKVEEGLPPEYVPIYDPVKNEWSIPQYMRSRGIRLKTAMEYQLGYCLSGRYANRLIFPCLMDGKVTTFQGRAMWESDSVNHKKYLGPKGHDKSKMLFGWDQAIGEDVIILCEGPVDVIGLAQAGYRGVALMGKALSRSQAKRLSRGGFSKFIIMLDPDAHARIYKTVAMLEQFVPAGTIWISRFPEPYDPGDAPKDVIHRAVAEVELPSLKERLRFALSQSTVEFNPTEEEDAEQEDEEETEVQGGVVDATSEREWLDAAGHSGHHRRSSSDGLSVGRQQG